MLLDKASALLDHRFFKCVELSGLHTTLDAPDRADLQRRDMNEGTYFMDPHRLITC